MPGIDDPEVRREILLRFCRLRPDGGPVFCVPSYAEREGRRASKGADGKVIFDSRELAEACAREFEAIGGNPQRAYRCNRGTAGHHHLTHDIPTASDPGHLRARRGAGS